MNKSISITGIAAAAMLFASAGNAASVTVTAYKTADNSVISSPIAPGTAFYFVVAATGMPDIVGADLGLTFSSAASVTGYTTSGAGPSYTVTGGVVLASGSPFTGGIVSTQIQPTFPSGAVISILAPTTGALPTGSFNAFQVNMVACAACSGFVNFGIDESPGGWTDNNTFAPVEGVTYDIANVEVAAVPAPAGLWLLGTGLAGLAARRLKKAA